ncbi:mitochondrial protein import protein Zim17p [Monosporozyma servazzii]
MLRSVAGRQLGTNLVRNLPSFQQSIPSLAVGLARYYARSRNNIGLITQRHCFHSISSLYNESKNPTLKNDAAASIPQENKTASVKTETPQLMIAFTCKKCNTRSSHTMSKQAYTKGTVLIQCPGCKNRHLIADHLKIFHDEKINIEDILKAKGENISQSTNDLVLEDIPEKLKPILSKYVHDDQIKQIKN